MKGQQLKNRMVVDPLTGVVTRYELERRLALEWKQALRHGQDLGVICLDLYGLKKVNDTLGRAVGDQVLREAASLACDRVRTSDTVARVGGDGFVIVCPKTSSSGLQALASDLERLFQHLPVRVSIGFAERERRDRNPADLILRADGEMYRNKKSHSNGHLLGTTGAERDLVPS